MPPLRFRDPDTGWVPSREQAQYLGGGAPLASKEDLRLAVGRAHGSDAVLARRLSERTGLDVIRVTEVTPEEDPLLGDSALRITLADSAKGDSVVTCPFPVTYPELVGKLTKTSKPEVAWLGDFPADSIEI